MDDFFEMSALCTYLMIRKYQCVGYNDVLGPSCCEYHDFCDVVWS